MLTKSFFIPVAVLGSILLLAGCRIGAIGRVFGGLRARRRIHYRTG